MNIISLEPSDSCRVNSLTDSCRVHVIIHVIIMVRKLGCFCKSELDNTDVFQSLLVIGGDLFGQQRSWKEFWRECGMISWIRGKLTPSRIKRTLLQWENMVATVSLVKDNMWMMWRWFLIIPANLTCRSWKILSEIKTHRIIHFLD